MNFATSAGNRILRESRLLSRDLQGAIGMSEQFFLTARGSRILIYHGICEQDHTRFNPIFLTRRTFESHLRFYRKYFNLISLDDYYQGNFNPDQFNCCLSFDDGYTNNLTHVLPLLEEYQAPAAFFITGIREAGYNILWNDFLGVISKDGPNRLEFRNEKYIKDRWGKYVSVQTGNSLSNQIREEGFSVKQELMSQFSDLFPKNPKEEEYWLQLDQAQIRQLSKSKFATIGSHGYYHNDLARINAAEASFELTKSKQYLENIIDKEINAIAFPYGSYSASVIELAKEAGYNQLLVMEYLTEADRQEPILKERLTINPFISTINQMHATITGKYN